MSISNKNRPNGKALVSLYVLGDLISFCRKYAGNYLEIGCYDGATLSIIAAALSGTGKICYGIDPFRGDKYVQTREERRQNSQFIPLPEQKKNLYKNISSYGHSIEFFEMTSENFWNSKTDEELEKMNISVVFVDGSHLYDYVTLDWKLALKVIGDKPGVVIFDDMQSSDVYRASNDMINHLKESGYKYKKNIRAFYTKTPEIPKTLVVRIN